MNHRQQHCDAHNHLPFVGDVGSDGIRGVVNHLDEADPQGDRNGLIVLDHSVQITPEAFCDRPLVRVEDNTRQQSPEQGNAEWFKDAVDIIKAEEYSSNCHNGYGLNEGVS